MKLISLLLLMVLSAGISAQESAKDSFAYARPRTFEYAFGDDGSHTASEKEMYQFRKVEIGKIRITSGKMVLSFVERIGKTEPFTIEFPRGEFPIEAAIGGEKGVEGGDHELLIYCRIKFSNEPVVRWEYAVRRNETKKQIGDSIYVSCPEENDTKFFAIVLGEVDAHKKFKGDKVPVKEYVNLNWDPNLQVKIVEKGQEKLIILYSEGQEVCYSSFIGYDKCGNICRLLVDPGHWQMQMCEFFKDGCQY